MLTKLFTREKTANAIFDRIGHPRYSYTTMFESYNFVIDTGKVRP